MANCKTVIINRKAAPKAPGRKKPCEMTPEEYRQMKRDRKCDSCNWIVKNSCETGLGVCMNKEIIPEDSYLNGLQGGHKVRLGKATCKGRGWRPAKTLPEDALFLILSRKWFEAIDSGEKTEEYRKCCEAWAKRIWHKNKILKRVVFQLGYSKARRMEFEIEGIYWVYPEHPDLPEPTPEPWLLLKPEWGYELGNGVFVIRLGKRIKGGLA